MRKRIDPAFKRRKEKRKKQLGVSYQVRHEKNEPVYDSTSSPTLDTAVGTGKNNSRQSEGRELFAKKGTPPKEKRERGKKGKELPHRVMMGLDTVMNSPNRPIIRNGCSRLARNKLPRAP